MAIEEGGDSTERGVGTLRVDSDTAEYPVRLLLGGDGAEHLGAAGLDSCDHQPSPVSMLAIGQIVQSRISTVPLPIGSM